MLLGKNRLILSKDFEILHKKGRFFSFGNVFLRVVSNNMPETRVGLSIGIKFSKKAVDRNKAKRQLREIVKKELVNMKKGFDVVIMLKREKNLPKYPQLEKDLLSTLSKSGLIIKK